MRQGLAVKTFVLALLTGSVCAFAPAAAEASKIDFGAYTAGPGEENHLTISYDYDAQVFRFHDTGVSSIEATGGGGCTTDGNDASCPIGWTGQVVARLGDGNDSAVVTNRLPHVKTPSNLYSGTVQLIGGDGNDLLDSGPGIPFTGDFMTAASASLWGDAFPNDSVDQGSGNDVLIGGAGDDGFLGGPGNDVEVGNGGRDSFDGSPFSTGSGSIAIYAGGADTMVGGPGSDTFNALESGGPNASDLIGCGNGEEGPLVAGFLPGRDMEIPGDVVAVGGGDTVASDCEAVAAMVECPEKLDNPCIGTTVVEGAAGRGGAAAASGRNRGGKVMVGRERFKIPPGRPIPVRVTLRHRRVNRLLGKRQSARVSQRATARSGKRRLKLDRKRFVLRRG